MSVEVGYITSWRRAMFFTFIIAIILFGTVSSICSVYVGVPLVSNIISVGVLVLCIAMFILVMADRNNKYTGTGTADIKDGKFIYNDKKRHFEILLSDIKKVDMEKITFVSLNADAAPMAYQMLIQTAKKKYYIESDRAQGRAYNEVDLHRLYIYLQEHMR